MRRAAPGLVGMALLAFASAAFADLLSQGDFGQGQAEWKLPNGAMIREESGNHFLHLE